MVNQMEDSPEVSNILNNENIGEAAIILISIGSVLVILCAASIIYSLRRRRHTLASLGGVPTKIDDSIHNPTDFMNRLATWDRSHSIDDMLEKRRKSVWTLEVFQNYGTSEEKTGKQFHLDS